ncbi:DUF2147 domain-containing protein [Hymenobacter terrenus]|uniref:DUF2147 domain-containing protein n=1 Tax=Hymenobacter terrenus TaxID=1629124 RepID=UPI0006966140|nr:DUF2147 domain-containing protein [Hymenobacter terrenus]
MLAILLFASAQAFAQSADAIVGKWLSEKKDAKIDIYKADNGKYYGKLFWGARMYEANGQTSRLAKNGKPFKDMVILKDFTFADGVWEDGTIYDPEEGKTYSCRMKLDGNRLNIRGYVGVSLFGRETVWQKI